MAVHSRFLISKQVHKDNYSMHSAHSHSYYEMFYLLHGSCDLLMNDNIYHLTPGNIAFIPIDALHRTSYKGSAFHERIDIEFTDNYAETLLSHTGKNWLRNNLFSKILFIPEEYRGEINHLLSLIIAENQTSDNFSQCMVKMYFQELLVKILRHINESPNMIITNEARTTDESIASAINYINENFSNNITLDDMANLLHLNPSYFSKKFKSVNGLGFKEYLNNVRINHSEKLLLETDMSITEIAFECGYENSNYYGDAFKKVNKVSPSTFRRMNGNVTEL